MKGHIVSSHISKTTNLKISRSIKKFPGLEGISDNASKSPADVRGVQLRGTKRSEMSSFCGNFKVPGVLGCQAVCRSCSPIQSRTSVAFRDAMACADGQVQVFVKILNASFFEIEFAHLHTPACPSASAMHIIVYSGVWLKICTLRCTCATLQLKWCPDGQA